MESNQNFDVFVSYSSKNKDIADAIVSDFEQNRIKCWYAPVMALTHSSPGMISLGAYQHLILFCSKSETIASAISLFFEE